MEWQPALKAWIWIDKPAVMIVPAPLRPLPKRWWSTFHGQASALRCLGTSRSGHPCKRVVYEWHTHLAGMSAPFVAHCRAHRGSALATNWRLWRIAERIPCPCGCGATVTAEASALTENPQHTDDGWQQVVAALGPVQWMNSTSVWTAWVTDNNSLALTAGIEGVLDATAYRDWLFDGPASLWENFPEDAPESEI